MATMGFQRTARVAHDVRADDLFMLMPPSMNHRGDNSSSGTTIPVHQAPKNLLITSPPWRHGTKVRLVESSDSTEVESKDKYLVSEQPEEREPVVEHPTPQPQSKRLRETVDTTQRQQSSANAIEHQPKDATIQDVSAVDSIELISLHPSIRKHKSNNLFSKLKRGVTRASPRVDLVSYVPHLGATKTKQEEASIEVRLLAWTEYKITVQIFDGQTKTKIQLKRDKEIKAKLPRIALIPCDANDHAKDDAKKQQQDDDESLGPDDIPHEVAYRTMPSIGSFVFQDIPPAASIPDVSDISSNSSDASDWTESDDDEDDFFGMSGGNKMVPEETMPSTKAAPKETKPPAVVAGKKMKKWNKRLFSGLRRRSSAE